MVRILWFKETTRWSRRGIPLRVVWVSPRQLTILLSSALAGIVADAPIPGATMKLIPLGALLLAGAVFAFWPVRMLAPEQLILLRLQSRTGSLRALYHRLRISRVVLRLRGRPDQLLQPQ